MKRLDYSEKKQLALEFIAKISEGYRLTGPNKAFDEAMRGKEAAITQSCLYQFIRGNEDLSQAYFKARDESRKRILSGSKHLGMKKRKELLALIIENKSKGMNIRGDAYRQNAIARIQGEVGAPEHGEKLVPKGPHRMARVDHSRIP